MIHINAFDDLNSLNPEALMSIVVGVAAETGKFDDDRLAELGRSVLACSQWTRVYFAEQSRDAYLAKNQGHDAINVVLYTEADVAERDNSPLQGKTILVPSDSFGKTGRMYQLTTVEGEAVACDCKGFEIRDNCKHVTRYNTSFKPTQKTQDYYESR